jgi:hypothetical protein
MAELLHNQIRLYPFDAEELDETELELNERIRVCPFVPIARTVSAGLTHCSDVLCLIESSSVSVNN